MIWVLKQNLYCWKVTFCYCDCSATVRDSTIHAAHTEGVLRKFGQNSFTFILMLDRSRTPDRKKKRLFSPPSHHTHLTVASPQSKATSITTLSHMNLWPLRTQKYATIFSVSPALFPLRPVPACRALPHHHIQAVKFPKCSLTAVITLTRCLSFYRCFTVVVSALNLCFVAHNLKKQQL